MDGMLRRSASEFRRRAGHGLLLLLGLTGALLSACSDNSGPAGPSFASTCAQAKVATAAACTGAPVPTTGHADTAAQIKVQVNINPNSITPGRRAGVTAIVTNLNGIPLPGKLVQFSTDVGSLDTVSGTTNAQGQFSTALRVTQTDAANCACSSATVTAFVEGASGTGVVNFGGAVQLVLVPLTTDATTGATIKAPASDTTIGQLNTCPALPGFTITYTVTGGAPPYTFSTAGAYPGATVSPAGVYTAPTLTGPFGIGPPKTDTVTVVDSLGTSQSATINFGCVAAFGTP